MAQYNARPHDRRGIEHIINVPHCGLFMGMALGKTAISLTAIKKLVFEMFKVHKVLIIAPLEISKTVWNGEAEKWDHLTGIKVVRIIGTEVERKKAVRTKGRFHIVNVDNINWLVAQHGTAWPYDMVVIDESSKFKNPTSNRFLALNDILIRGYIKRAVLLTGTPIPNGYLDLWAQIYILDGGKRLLPTFEAYKEVYFTHNKYTHKYELRDGAKEEIDNLISDICISMRTKDFAEIPDVLYKDINVELPTKVMKAYKDFERDLVLALNDTDELTVESALTLSNKLLQFTNGAIYDEEGNTHIIHECKMDALAEFIEEAQGENVLVAYHFQSDLARLKKRFGGTWFKEKGAQERWNKGEINLMWIHPKSGGHGLNLQFGGHILAHYGLDWPLEDYEQINARLPRPGQKAPYVATARIVCPGTIDMKVSARLASKGDDQSGMLDAIKAIIKEYKK